MRKQQQTWKRCLFSCFLLSCLLMTVAAGSKNQENIQKSSTAPVKLFLKGSPYEMGFQHGRQLKEAIAYNVKRLIDDRILANQDHPQIKTFLAALPQVIEEIPKDYIQEMRGMSNGSQISYDKILLLNLFPEMFHCSGLTLKGNATQGGELFHVRVLDYAAAIDLQDTAILMIAEPEGKIPFMNIAYAGFIGSVTGMNVEHIAIGEIGGKGYGQYEGMPMAFLLRSLLERASNLQEVKEILASTPRTCEYYYVFSDGKSKESIGVYATHQQLQYIEPGFPYAIFDPSVSSQQEKLSQIPDNKLVLNQHQIETSLYQTLLFKDRQKQSLWGLIHQQPKDCLVLTGFCHFGRYPILVQRILAHYGHLALADIQDLIKGDAGRPSNLHTAIFAPKTLDAWIAHAGVNGEPAWSQPYSHFNLNQLLEEAKHNSD